MISGTYYSIGEVAKELGRHRNTVSRWIREGRLSAIRVGNIALISKEDLDRLRVELTEGVGA